jgi:ABC-type dipeptide/oligopeptide/nickel transport system permease subunit
MARKDKSVEIVNDANENAIANKETEGLSQGQIVFRRFIRHRAAMFSVVFLFTLITVVFTSLDWRIGNKDNPLFTIPGWWKYGFEDMPELRYADCPGGTVGCPTIDGIPFFDGDGVSLGEHPFGQDDIGRDYLALVMRGAQRSILVMFIIGIIAATLGTVIGAVSGYFRGFVDAALMRLVDFIITVPVIIIGSVIGFHYGNKGAAFLALLLGLLSPHYL